MTIHPDGSAGIRPLRQVRRLVATVLALALASGGLVVLGLSPIAPMPQAQAAPSDPFALGTGTVWVADGNPTLLHEAEQRAGEIVFGLGERDTSTNLRYNAIAYHAGSKYIYAMKDATSTLLKIGQGGHVVSQAPLMVAGTGGTASTRFPLGFTADQGTFGAGTQTNTYFFRAGSSARMFAVDVTDSSPVARPIVLSPNIGGVADMVWKDGFLWAVGGLEQEIYRIDPVSGATRAWSTDASSSNFLDIAQRAYGAQWIYGNGNIGISATGPGQATAPVYQIGIAGAATANPTFAVVSATTGRAGALTDGTAAPGADVDLELVKTAEDFFLSSTVVYTLTVTNKSATQASSGFVVTDAVPSMLNNPVTSSPGCTIASDIVQCIGGRLPPGASVTFTFAGDPSGDISGGGQCIASPTSAGGDLIPASVRGNENDPNASNDVDDASACAKYIPDATFIVKKEADVTEALPGGTVTYTTTIENDGSESFLAGAPASFTDDLSGVLDDAILIGSIVATKGSAGYDSVAKTLSWSEPLDPGEIVEIVYTVMVKGAGWADSMLRNTLLPGDGGRCSSISDCYTETPVKHYVVSKSADVDEVAPYGLVTYTVTITNTGQVDYLDASFVDDLSDVVDDADVVTSTVSGGAVYDSGSTSVIWSGPLAIGESMSISYSVEAISTFVSPATMVGMVAADGAGGSCEAILGCTTTTGAALSRYAVTKTADVASARPGDVVEYTIVMTNTGPGDLFGADAPAFTDDLIDVLDDGEFLDGTVTLFKIDPDDFEYVESNSTLVWRAELEQGQSATLSYKVEVGHAQGDRHLVNSVITDGGPCPPGTVNPDCSSLVLIEDYTIEKVVDATFAVPGAPLNYSITVTNIGAVDFTAADPVWFEDDLSDVLDDATLNVASVTGNATFTSSTIEWEEPVAIGLPVTVSYQVEVDDPVVGDGKLLNVVADPYHCVDPATAGCSTLTSVATPQYSTVISADKATTKPGDLLRYSVTVTNTGAVPFTVTVPVTFENDLSGVLLHADYNDDESGGVYDPLTKVLSWEGALALGASVTVTYSVTIHEDAPATTLRGGVVTPASGGCDALLANAQCRSATLVTLRVAQLPFMGAQVTAAVLLGLASLLLGGVFMLVHLRRRGARV